MRRFVYSPRVDAWVKTDWGVVDLRAFITAGSVTRRVQQVSSAELTLRNPDFRWTQRRVRIRSSVSGEKIEEVLPVFHPMDPIVITLTRLKDRPVQVFTGYLDTTPYIELYPGTVVLKASCTLKRLLHTYWDPAVEGSFSLLKRNGWIMGKDGQYFGPQGDNSESDSSFGKLLESVLKEVGGWKEENIHIGSIPSALPAKVAALTKDIEEDSAAAKKEVDRLLAGIIGIGAYGAGNVTSGGSTGGTPGGALPTGKIAGDENITKKMCEIARSYNIPPELAVATWLIEWPGKKDTPGNPHYGWFQQQTANPPYIYGTNSNRKPTIEETHDLGLATTAFASAAAGWGKANPTLKGDLREWAMKTQGVTCGNNPLYCDGTYERNLAKAKQMLSKYGCGDSGLNPNSPDNTAPSSNLVDGGGSAPSKTVRGSVASTSGGSSSSSSGSNCENGTRFDAITAEANRLNDAAPSYSRGSREGPTSYDCSSSCAQLLRTAGYDVPFFSTHSFPSAMGSNVVRGEDPSGRLTFWVSDHGQHLGSNPDDHMFAQIGDRMWGTGHGTPNGGPGWNTHPTGNFVPFHLKTGALDACADKKVEGNTTVPGGSPGSGGTGSGTGGIGGDVWGGANPIPWSQVRSEAKAVAFAALLEAPSLADIQEAALLTGKRSLLNDTPLLPFIEQITTASMRSFMSLPNGDFFAFYPDYFGSMGRQPYWLIDDIEILDGKIELSDDALATHVYVVGDTSAPFGGFGGGGIDWIDRVQTRGVVTLQDAFRSGFLNLNPVPQGSSERDEGKVEDRLLDLTNTKDAIKFLQKYGARPKLIEMPMIRNPYYELFMAYQTFCLMWSQQFLTEFTFTFMPEVFPGGIVAFPDHGIQCYVNEVTHTFDYQTGFQTQATLMAPSAIDDSMARGVNVGMVRAGGGLSDSPGFNIPDFTKGLFSLDDKRGR